MSTFTWNQSSGNLASTAANWTSDAASTSATQFSTTASSIPGHDGTPMQTRNSSGRLFAVGLRDSDGAAMVWYTDNDWTGTTEVVVDGTNVGYDSLAIAVDSGDDLYILAQNNSTGMYIYESTNAGVSWGSRSSDFSGGTTGAGTGCNLAIDNDDFLHMMWDGATSGETRYCVSTAANPTPAAIAVEDSKGGSSGTEAINTTGATAFFDMCLQASSRITHNNSPGGIAVGDSISGGTSGATGIVTTVTGTTEISYIPLTGTFQSGETITGDSGSADSTGSPTNGFGVLVVYDNGNVDFRRKEDNVTWADASSPSAIQVELTGANPSICVSDNDDVIFFGFEANDGAPSADPYVRISTDGGASVSSRVEIAAVTNNSGVSVGYGQGYFWVIHGDNVQNIYYAQVYADANSTVPVLIANTEEDGTAAGDNKRSTRVRWTRFHYNSPDELDMIWDNTTDSQLEGRQITGSLPNIVDDVVFDSTSTANCTWDITPTGSLSDRVASLDLDTGYSGTFTSTVTLEINGGITHTAGTLNINSGNDIDTYFSTFNSSVTTTWQGTCNVATSITISGTNIFQVSGSSGVATLTCPLVTGAGVFRLTSNTTNRCILRGPDTSTYCVWNLAAPDLDFAGAGSLSQFGSVGTNRGVDFDTNSIAFTAGTNTTLDLEERNLFAGLTYGGATIDANASVVIIDGNLDSTSGTFTPTTSEVQFTGTGTTIQTNPTSDNFNDVTVTGTPTVSTQGIIIDAGGTFTNTGTLTCNAPLTLFGSAITNFDNSGGTIAGNDIIAFNNNVGGAVTLDNFGIISIDDVFFIETVGTISLGENFTHTGSSGVGISGDLNLAGFDIVSGGALTCTGTLDASTAGSSTTVNGSADFTGGTYTSGSNDFIDFDASATFTPDGNSFRQIDISVGTCTLSGSLVMTSSLNINTGATFATGGNTVTWTGSGLSPVNLAGTISGGGTFVFSPSTTTQWNINSRSDYPSITAGGTAAATFQAQGAIGATGIDMSTSGQAHIWDFQNNDMTLTGFARVGTGQSWIADNGTHVGTMEFIGTDGTVTIDVSGSTITGTTGAALNFVTDPSSLSMIGTTAIGASSNPGAIFNTSSWTPSFTSIDDSIFTAGSGSQDIEVNGPIVEMRDCTLTNATASMSNAASGLAVWGNIAGGSATVLLLWGAIDFTADLQDSTPVGYEIRLFDDDGGSGNHCSATVNSTFSPLSWVAEVNTTTTTTSGNTLTIDPTTTVTGHSFGTFACDGDFVFSPTSALTFNIELLGTTTITSNGSWTSVPGVNATFDLEIYDDQHLRVNGGTLTLTGNTTRLLTVQQQQGGGANNGNIRCSSGTLALSFCELDTLGHGSAPFLGAIYVDGTTSGTVDNCLITSPGNAGIHINGGDNSIAFSDISITGGAYGVRHLSVSSDNISFEGIASANSTIAGLAIATATFTGKIRNFLGDSLSVGAAFEADAGIGTITDSAFNGDTLDLSVSSNSTVDMVSCIFDTNNITVVTGSSLISWQHNRTNTKEVYISTNQTINSSYYSTVNQDVFNWTQTVLGGWTVNASNRFESLSGTSDLRSIFIPVSPSRAYYIRFRGSIGGDSGTPVTVQGYRADQSTTTVSVTAFTLSGSDYLLTTPPFTTDANTAFIRFEINPSTSGLEFYDIEVRETSAGGSLIFNEDLITNFLWPPGTGWQYNDGGKTNLLSGNGLLVFGDDDYYRVDANADFKVTSSSGGWVLGWQDNNNYYRVYVDRIAGSIKVDKIVGGVTTNLDSATTIGGVALGTAWPSGSVANLEVQWNDFATGAIEVVVDGVTIEGTAGLGDWTTSSANYVSDTTFSQGKIGFYANNTTTTIDNLIVRHFGFFLRDVNLTLATGVILTLNGGLYDYEDGTVNAARASTLILTLGTENEANVTWTDSGVLDPTIATLSTYNCTSFLVPGNLILGAGAKMVSDGGIFDPVSGVEEWTIITEGSSTFYPPIDFQGVKLRKFNTRFRLIGGGGGETYEVKRSNGEYLVDGKMGEKTTRFFSNPVIGLARDRSSPKGVGDRLATLLFETTDNCLVGKLRRWQVEQYTVEVIWPNDYMIANIVGIFENRSPSNMKQKRFTLELRETR